MRTGLGTEQAGSRAPLVKWVGLWVPVGLGRNSLGWEERSGFLFSTSWRKEDNVWWAPREIGSDLLETFVWYLL